MTKQDLCNSFYAIDNIVTIHIRMPAGDWEALRNAEPHGGRCQFEYTGDRFDWFATTSVELSGSAFPAGGTYSFLSVAISKKSFCGSFSTTKPSLKLDFSKFRAGNEDLVEDLIGTQFLTLNNCIQDPSYIRQPLGYFLFKQAGLPYSRCNFSRVYVNDVYQGVYVNVEPIKKRYVQNNFNGNDKGNLYELEFGEDFTPEIMQTDRIEFEGFSKHTNKRDLQLATTEIASNGVAGMERVIDAPQFLRYFAMEALLKHWDSYTDNRNNVYVYNDVDTVANPTVANVNFKFLPWGLDQILQDNQRFQKDDDSVLGNLVLSDPTKHAQLNNEIRNYVNTIFDRDSYRDVLAPYIGQMRSTLAQMGMLDLGSAIDVVAQQLRLVKSGGFQLIGEYPTDSAFLISKETGTCAHASNTEFVGGEGGHQEVYHYAPTTALADRWYFQPRSGEHVLKNRAYDTHLHWSTTQSPSGNLRVYSFRFELDDERGLFHVWPVDFTETGERSGYFVLQGVGGGYVRFGETDLTPKGRKRLYQVPRQDATVLYLF